MALTEEQRERMRMNRERALEIRRKKMEEAADEAAKKKDSAKGKGIHSISGVNNNNNKRGGDDEKAVLLEEEEDVELEEFEIGVSQFVTKREAMQTYCLPDATLSICPFIERDNPRNKNWNTMKLFYRSDIRRRARERHGGILGLVEERNKRKRKQLERDLENNKDIFKRNKT
uniref:XPA C-terminal domain-containing protein n=1 Tax=Eucampia antarctica TaxID=49252 RepID=A0A7S2WHM1_9STRA|mmetsp:Transcript_29779/g.28649  ORF Transcript_29779/g.28649 Transcript_29779/m.28649 type:complete len:173 (+) Transcript_29779:264-782(+)|eukprot:CAMPEP_0197831408 /NCGR_PEP_ID=MMETSP1437-20131217/9860_1 /TAXON_ID=49252 ORGANISM="Eucampia antarctica, Strain CCMP1452" /NCGR_SAMPLE_ID=MMETSP1437 /ASSEMBLY_ACC=CAM_ASM_001096 /LENGTH=172 /DNA_ID=CAMNT_0043434307 /DNA_START=274 /DNA_END=792 /DNA_ORIENTATION=+